MIQKFIFKNLNYYTAYNADDKGQPIIIHIHGAGSRGEDLDVAIKSNPIIKFMDGNANFPFKVYAPQCYANTWFDIYEHLLEFIFFVKRTNPNSKIYLTGVSMGGYCAWQILTSLPEFFEKAIVCCGGGMYWNADRIKTPVKAFHGKLDKVVYPEESVKMCNAVNNSGGQATLTLYDDLEHNCWDRAFLNENNYQWLLRD